MPRPARRRRASPPSSQSMLTPPPPPPATSPRTPATPASDLAARIGDFSMASPVTALPSLSGNDFFAQNRAILLAGMTPASPAPSASSPPPAVPSIKKQAQQQQQQQQKQQKHQQHLPLSPPPPARHPRLTPLVTPKSLHHRHRLAVVAPSPRALSPCIYVKATAMRSPPPPGSTPPPESGTGTATGGSLLVTARVRPVAAGREPFVIERAFARARLRDAVRGELSASSPGGPGGNSFVSIVPSPLRARAPLNPWPASPAPGTKRPAPGDNDNDGDDNNNDDDDDDNDEDNAETPRPGPSPSLKVASPDQFHHDGGIPIPYVHHVSLGTLPALAAVVLSGFVKPNDVVELPMPHPAAWPQTVAYVYTGDGPLSEAMRRNIEHLGGEV